jgi:chemotaxis protein CheD
VSALSLTASRERRFLQPGQLVVSTVPMTVTTILGSCVSVCLWDGQKRIGGLNHFMLPMVAGASVSSPRFGNIAMETLVEDLRASGARLPFLTARVFGGACMFTQMQSSAHLGAKNVEVALDFLQRRGIAIAQVDVGGNRGRKLVFETESGTACLNTI